MHVRDAHSVHAGSLMRHMHVWQFLHRHFLRKRQYSDFVDQSEIDCGWRLLIFFRTDRIIDQHWPTLGRADLLLRNGVNPSLVKAIHPILSKFRTAMRTRKFIVHPLGFLVKCLSKEVYFTSTFWAGKHLAPDRVIDPALGLAVGVERLVHPTKLFFHLGQDALSRASERVDVERQSV